MTKYKGLYTFDTDTHKYVPITQIPEIWDLTKEEEENDHKKLKWFEHKIIHLIATFILGVALATIFHVIIMNHQVRTTAEAVCNVFGRDAEECKGGIDNVLNMSDEDIQNNMTIKGE